MRAWPYAVHEFAFCVWSVCFVLCLLCGAVETHGLYLHDVFTCCGTDCRPVQRRHFASQSIAAILHRPVLLFNTGLRPEVLSIPAGFSARLGGFHAPCIIFRHVRILCFASRRTFHVHARNSFSFRVL